MSNGFTPRVIGWSLASVALVIIQVGLTDHTGLKVAADPPGRAWLSARSRRTARPFPEPISSPATWSQPLLSQEVDRPLDFERAILGHKPGDELPLTVHRGDDIVKLKLKLAALPSHPTGDADLAWDVLGLHLAPISATQFKQYQSKYRGGLSVTEVRPDSPAAKQGLRRGDVLVGMHIWETVSLDNVTYILNRPDFSDLEPMKFHILRNNETLYGHFNVSLQRKVTRE